MIEPARGSLQTRARIAAVVFSVLIGLASPVVAQVDQQRTQECFKSAQALCERDGGRLWGVSLCAPMVIGDMRTRTFATSHRVTQERQRGADEPQIPVQSILRTSRQRET